LPSFLDWFFSGDGFLLVTSARSFFSPSPFYRVISCWDRLDSDFMTPINGFGERGITPPIDFFILLRMRVFPHFPQYFSSPRSTAFFGGFVPFPLPSFFLFGDSLPGRPRRNCFCCPEPVFDSVRSHSSCFMEIVPLYAWPIGRTSFLPLGFQDDRRAPPSTSALWFASARSLLASPCLDHFFSHQMTVVPGRIWSISRISIRIFPSPLFRKVFCAVRFPRTPCALGKAAFHPPEVTSHSTEVFSPTFSFLLARMPLLGTPW